MNELELYHYGVKGMKWGIRRFQKKNGKLTSAGKERYSDESRVTEKGKSKHRLNLEKKYRSKGMSQDDAEKAADKRIKMEKVIAVTAGVTVAAATAYVVTKHIRERADGIIKAGTQLQRITIDDQEDLNRAFYAAYNKTDKIKYAGLYGKDLDDRLLFKATIPQWKDNVKQVTLDVNSDIKVASRKKASDTFVELYKNNENFRKLVDNKFSFKDMTDRQLRDKGYDLFNQGLVDHSPEGGSIAKQFYDRLTYKGYDAIIDMNDKKLSGYNAKKPVIVFNNKNKITKSSAVEMTTDTINSYLRKANHILFKENTMREVGKTGAKFAAGFGATSIYTTFIMSMSNKAINNYRIAHPNSGLSDREIYTILMRQG